MSVYHENALEPGSSLAEYTLESVLGHGGFGITYLARDTSLGSFVAIKEYLPQEIATRDKRGTMVIPHASRDAIKHYHWGLKTFVKEARALARFKHPNIVRVLRFIEANGTAYTVMEYEQGQTLAQHLKSSRQRLDEPTLFRIIMPILNGLHEVHEAKLLHLDIKPENIYIRRDGNPMLIDFGSARQAMTESTQSRRMTLTHGYAPIEQYPDKGKLGPWSDVYAIGATMYRCTCGRRPQDSIDRYRAVLDYKVDPLKAAVQAGAKHYRPALLECVDWAMQIHAKDRPQSARELQDSLMGHGGRNRGTTGRSSTPKHVAPTIAPARRTARPRRSALNRRGIATLALVAALAVLVWSQWSQLMEALTMLSVSLKTPAREGAATDDPSAVPTSKAPAQTTSSAGADSGKAQGPPSASSTPSTLRQVLGGHGDWIQAIAFAPAGQRLATASNDRTIRLWDTGTGTWVATLKQGYAVTAIAYSPDGHRLATAGVDGVVRLWDARAASALGPLESSTTYPLFAVAYSPDGRTIAAAGKDRAVYIWDAASGKTRHTLEGHTGEINALAFMPGGRELVSAGGDRVIRLWNVDTGQAIATLSSHKDVVQALASSADGRWLASGDAGHTIRIWDMRTQTVVRTLTDARQAVLGLAFGPNGAWLAAACADNVVNVFELEHGRLVQTLSGHEGPVQAVAVSADGKLLASGGRDHNVRLWHAAN